jgi:hypothetical protein
LWDHGMPGFMEHSAMALYLFGNMKEFRCFSLPEQDLDGVLLLGISVDTSIA